MAVDAEERAGFFAGDFEHGLGGAQRLDVDGAIQETVDLHEAAEHFFAHRYDASA